MQCGTHLSASFFFLWVPFGLFPAGSAVSFIERPCRTSPYNPLSLLLCNRKLIKPLLLTVFLWNSEAFNTFPVTNWSILALSYSRGHGRPFWDQMFVIFMGQSLILIIPWTWMNNEVNSVSSGINSVVSICKTTLSVYCESVTILRGSLKFLSTMRIACNSAF